MTYGMTWVPYGNLTAILPQLVPYLRKSELVSHGRSSIDDIVRYLYTGQMLLWVIYEEGTEKPVAYVVTEVKQYPQQKMLVWQYVASDEGILDGVEELTHKTIESFAKDVGCNGLEAVGRFGWKRMTKNFGYKSYAVLYEKFFD